MVCLSTIRNIWNKNFQQKKRSGDHHYCHWQRLLNCDHNADIENDRVQTYIDEQHEGWNFV